LDHLLIPLENLRQEVDFFAREESLRLLHVTVDPALHGPALDPHPPPGAVRAAHGAHGERRGDALGEV